MQLTMVRHNEDVDTFVNASINQTIHQPTNHIVSVSQVSIHLCIISWYNTIMKYRSGCKHWKSLSSYSCRSSSSRSSRRSCSGSSSSCSSIRSSSSSSNSNRVMVVEAVVVVVVVIVVVAIVVVVVVVVNHYDLTEPGKVWNHRQHERLVLIFKRSLSPTMLIAISWTGLCETLDAGYIQQKNIPEHTALYTLPDMTCGNDN